MRHHGGARCRAARGAALQGHAGACRHACLLPRRLGHGWLLGGLAGQHARGVPVLCRQARRRGGEPRGVWGWRVSKPGRTWLGAAGPAPCFKCPCSLPRSLPLFPHSPVPPLNSLPPPPPFHPPPLSQISHTTPRAPGALTRDCRRAELAAEGGPLHGRQVALLGVVSRQVEVAHLQAGASQGNRGIQGGKGAFTQTGMQREGSAGRIGRSRGINH